MLLSFLYIAQVLVEDKSMQNPCSLVWIHVSLQRHRHDDPHESPMGPIHQSEPAENNQNQFGISILECVMILKINVLTFI